MRISVEGYLAVAVVWELGEATPTQVREKAGLSSGTVSPLLRRLEDSGILASRKEAGEPSALKRPRRVFYRVTDIESVRAASVPLAAALSALATA